MDTESTTAEGQDSEGLSAAETFAAIGAQLENLERTIVSLRQRPGLKPHIVASVHQLAAERERLHKLINDRHFAHHARAERANHKRAEEGRKRHEFQWRRQSLSDGQDAAGLSPELREKLAAELRALEANALSCVSAERAAEAEYEHYTGLDQEYRAKRDLDLEAHLAALMGLVEKARRLHEEATRGDSLAEKGQERIEARRTEFEDALRYHREQARLLLWFAGVATVLALLAAAWLFGLFGAAVVAPRSGGPELADWVHLGGRLSLVFGAGAAVNFLGILHSRHAQQAVWYQDRLAGLDLAVMLLHYGTSGTREEILRQMTKTYLECSKNAFVKPVQGTGFSRRDVRFALKAMKQLISATTPRP